MKTKLAAVALAATLAPGMALATDGYFSHGYGMTAKGMGGAATAMSSDTFGGANNPASMVWVGNRFDVGIDWFRPIREASRSGSAGAGTGLDGSAKSGSDNFLIPEFGYNRMINPRMSLGVTLYGNGGMNTDYPGGQIGGATACAGFNPPGAPYNLLCGSGKLNMDMMQLIIAPTLAMKINANNSFGISPLIGYQRFKVDGLQGFAGFTSNPANPALTNQGYDSAHGFGVRVGWMGKLTDKVTLGAAYSTKIKMSSFEKYKDLFAEQGEFDVPENYNLGIAVKATDKVTIAADYQHINYSGVNSVGNSSAAGGLTIGGTLGCDTCRGFGWQSVNVLKLGVEYQYNSNLTLRAGYNHTDNPIQASDVTFNIIAPGVVQDHVTLGFTYGLGDGADVTMAYMHAFSNSVTGSSLFANWVPGTGNEKIQMYEDSLGIAYSKKY